MLVEFEPGATPGLGFFAMQNELSKALSREVDLHTPAFLSERFRDQAIREAKDLYVAA